MVAGAERLGFDVRLRQACCLNGTVAIRVRPGFGRMTATLVPPPGGWVGQWPTAWLGGLGTRGTPCSSAAPFAWSPRR
jgi:general secretion pathway protein N